MILIVAIMPMVSADKPITDIQTDAGYVIEPTIKSFIKTGELHEFELHIFNVSNGLPIIEGLSCYMHLYHDVGNHEYEGFDATINHNFDYAFDVAGGNFTDRGMYQAKFQCNDSIYGGGTEIEFGVNDYGEELTPAITSSHNQSMWFLMILFGLCVGGIIGFKNLIGKWACYMVAHLLFIIGTFAEWQFLQGYAMGYIVNAGIFKTLFYFSISAFFPIIIISIAGMIIYFATEKRVMNLIDHGMDEGEARNRQRRKFR